MIQIAAKKSRYVRILMGIILWMSSPSLVSGQILEPVTFQAEATATPDEAVKGKPFTLIVQAEIEESWYLYSAQNSPDDGPIPTHFTIESNDGKLVIRDSIEESDPEQLYDPNFGVTLGLHSGSARFRIPAHFTNPPESPEFYLTVTWQACDDISCLPPRTREFHFSVKEKEYRVHSRELHSARLSTSAESVGQDYSVFLGAAVFFLLISTLFIVWFIVVRRG